ncbi:MAG: tetratricopeptide repeat protein [Fibrobacterota bacterium]
MKNNTMRFLCAVGIAAVLTVSCVTPVDVDTEDVKRYNRGRTLQTDSADLHGAVKVFTDIIENYPWSSKYDNALYRRGICYYDIAAAAERPDSAEFYLQKTRADCRALSQKSNLLVDGLFLSATAQRLRCDFAETGSADSVKAAFLRIMEAYPAHEKAAESCLELGGFYYDAKNLDSARVYYEKFPAEYATPDSNSSAEALMRLGHIARKQQGSAAALLKYEEVLNSYQSSWYYDNALYWAGSAAMDLGRTDTAQAYLKEYVDNYPNETYADKAQEKLTSLNN